METDNTHLEKRAHSLETDILEPTIKKTNHNPPTTTEEIKVLQNLIV